MHAVIIASIHKYKGKKIFWRMKRGLKDSSGTIKEPVIVLLCHWTSEPLLLVRIQIKRERLCDKFKGSDMASVKIFAVLLVTTIIGTVLARPGYGGYGGYGGYIKHSTPISYTSYSYPSYSYPSYGYGHSLHSSYNYPLYGYGHGGHGLGGWLGDYW